MNERPDFSRRVGPPRSAEQLGIPARATATPIFDRLLAATVLHRYFAGFHRRRAELTAWHPPPEMPPPLPADLEDPSA